MNIRTTKNKESKTKSKNKILLLAKDNTIPYIKDLRRLPMVKSVVACILMQQLDYWFHIQGNETDFYKFLEPSPNQSAYRVGDSWTEELGIGVDQYRTAFDQIGTRYKDKKSYNAATDKFQGKYYCSYFNKVTRQTHYFRNNELLDSHLDFLFLRNGQFQSPEMNNADSVGMDKTNSVEVEYYNPESTENTTKTTSKREEENSHFVDVDKEYKDDKGNGNYGFNPYQSDFNHIPSNTCMGLPAGDDDEVIEGVPVFDGEPGKIFGAGEKFSYLSDDFQLSDEMRSWAAENISAEIDIDFATRKFTTHYRGQKHKDWIRCWEMWMLRERPEMKIGGYKTASKRKWEQLQEEYNTDLFADVTD